ncbi:MAG: ECF-type sigma factor [Steroidobacteraceae bacterium]
MDKEAITVLLEAVRRGNAGAVDDLFSAVYAELRRLARSHRRRWRGHDTLGTTALIHEAYLRLAGSEHLSWQNRTHFYATASKAMRQVLINYAERVNAEKRGGGADRIALEDAELRSEAAVEDLLSLTQQLEALEADNPRRCRIVECRVFGGMDVEETAAALGISPATVKRDWKIAAAFLRKNMQGDVDALAGR